MSTTAVLLASYSEGIGIATAARLTLAWIVVLASVSAGEAILRGDIGQATVSALVGYVLVFASAKFLSSFGDVARFIDDDAVNAHARGNVLRGAVELITKVNDSSRYQRVVVVAHSLGSIVGYEALHHAFAAVSEQIPVLGNDPSFDDRNEAYVELLKQLNTEEVSQEQLREAKDNLRRKLNEQSDRKRWIVSDFITLGSPLAHSDFLWGDSGEFVKRLEQRRFSAAPPLRQRSGPSATFGEQSVLADHGYDDDARPGWRYVFWRSQATPRFAALHHAAVFALTNWTALFYRNDIFGGPIGEGTPSVSAELRSGHEDPTAVRVFRDVKDVPLDSTRRTLAGFARAYSHSYYWNQPPSKRLHDGWRACLDQLEEIISRSTSA